MAIEEFMETFAGRPIVQYDPEVGVARGGVVAYRTGPRDRSAYAEYDFAEELTAFLADPDLSSLEALVIGPWCYDFQPEFSDRDRHVQKLMTMTGGM